MVRCNRESSSFISLVPSDDYSLIYSKLFSLSYSTIEFLLILTGLSLGVNAITRLLLISGVKDGCFIIGGLSGLINFTSMTFSLSKNPPNYKGNSAYSLTFFYTTTLFLGITFIRFLSVV